MDVWREIYGWITKLDVWQNLINNYFDLLKIKMSVRQVKEHVNIRVLTLRGHSSVSVAMATNYIVTTKIV